MGTANEFVYTISNLHLQKWRYNINIFKTDNSYV